MNQVLSNGDLLIRNISWKDMGSYTCSCTNDTGVDEISTFLYPVSIRLLALMLSSHVIRI